MASLPATKITEDHIRKYDLRYVYEEEPGITRAKRGRGFSYFMPDGTLIRNDDVRNRLKDIAVPPTYHDVWYCPDAAGHLQATGIDSNQKKQYFYHELWEYLRDQAKFHNLRHFGLALPAFRRHLRDRLKHSDPTDRDAVLAAMARILDRTGMRVGSRQAAEHNDTYGLTTLEDDHLDDLNKRRIVLTYTGKGGKAQERALTDPLIVQTIDQCVEIPGQKLFSYTDKRRDVHIVDSGLLNSFIKSIMGEAFSAKDFRTWRFCSLFVSTALSHHQKAKSAGHTVTLKDIVETVAEDSGNTPAVLKSSYIHPGLIAVVKNGLWLLLQKTTHKKYELRKAEVHLLSYLHSDHADEALKP